MTKNYMELLVSSILGEIIVNYQICKCQDCLNDIKSVALNTLPPMYFLSTALEGEKTVFLLDRQRKISVLAKVVEAIETIKKNDHNKS